MRFGAPPGPLTQKGTMMFASTLAWMNQNGPVQFNGKDILILGLLIILFAGLGYLIATTPGR